MIVKRILCALLTAILVLAFSASANATVYTHPEAGFHLTVPEGWWAVDSTNAEEMMASNRVSAELAATLSSIRPILDSTACVYLFKEDVVSPPFVNISVEFKGELDKETTLDDLLATAQAYEAYYLEDQDQFPGYAVTVPADTEQAEGWYSMGYLGGVYEKNGYRIALAQIFVASGTRFYEFTLTAEEGKVSGAYADFSNLVSSLIAQGDSPETVGAQADEAVLKRGAELLDAQDYEGALAHFDAAIADHGDVAKYHAERGEALFKLERYQEMADSHNTAIQLDADFWEYYNERGVAYFYLGQWEEALSDFQRAVDLDADKEEAYSNLAYLQGEMGQAEESILTYAFGITAFPESDGLWYDLGEAQFRLGHYAEALAAYDQALALADGAYTAEDIPNYAAAKEQAASPALITYSLGDESIPSIDSVVGFRDISGSEAGFNKGGPFVKVNYRSGSVQADMEAYVTAMMDNGWAATELVGDESGGTIRMAIESAEDGMLLTVAAEYTADAYSILVQRADGALRRYTDDYGNKMGEVLQTGTPIIPVTPAEPDDIIGAWAMISMEMEGVSMHPSELGMEMTMEFLADHTVLLHSSMDGDMTATWAISDGQVIVSGEDDTEVVLVLIDGNLCVEQNGVIFSKEKAQDEGTASDLSPYFPADRITLPEGSEVIRVFKGETNEYSAGDYIEITEVQLPLTKTEAVEYFTEMLNRGDEDYFVTNEVWFLPGAITAAYPDVTDDFMVTALYSHSRDVRGITVHLFIKGGEETVYASYVEVTYAKDPSIPVTIPTELSIASLRQVFADMGYWTSDEIPAMVVGDLEPVDGFETNCEQKSGGAWVNIKFIEFKDDADLQRYIKYREGYAKNTAFGLIYVEYTEDTEEVARYIEDVVKAAGG